MQKTEKALKLGREYGEYFYIQLFGHKKLVGVVTIPENIEGMIHLQVLSKNNSEKVWYTKYVNFNAIYDMTSISKETAEKIAPKINNNPINEWEFEDLVKDKLKKVFPDIDWDKKIKESDLPF